MGGVGFFGGVWHKGDVRLIVLPHVTSTMEEARARLAAGEPCDGVLALCQTAGRGRLGRPWLTLDAPYGLACTYILTPARVGGAGGHLPLVVALAVHKALLEAGAEGVFIKWPNDIVTQTQKIAGVLCEASAQGVLVGVGVNLRCPPQGAPAGFMGGFAGVSVPPEKMAEKIGACILQTLALYNQHGWGALHSAYTHACVTLGQRISWRGPAGDIELTGLARGLNPSGHLELVADDGTVHIITGGDIMAQA